MAKILSFPTHARSRTGRNRNTRGSTRPFKRAEKAKKRLGGMLPRIFQLETAVVPTPASLAASAGPPTAAITASTVLSMPPYRTRSVVLSSGHEPLLEEPDAVSSNDDMPDIEDVAFRLRALREYRRLTQRDFGKTVRCSKSRWSNFENKIRMLPVDVAERICDAHGVTLDWIYRGRLIGMPAELIIALPIPPPRRKRA